MRNHESRHGFDERREPRALRLERQWAAVDVKTIEEERCERQLLAQLVDFQAPAEPPHGFLKWQRPSVLTERDHLAVEDELAARHGSHQLGDFGHGRRHVSQSAGEDLHVLAALVNLNARAVELDFEGRFAQPLQRLSDISGWRRQHRLDGPEELDSVAKERGRALGHRDVRDFTQIAAHHGRMPDGIRRPLSRLGDRLGEDARERALAQVSGDQANEKVLLLRRRLGEQLRQQPRPCRRGARSRGLRNLAEDSIDVDEVEGWRVGSRRVSRLRGRRPSEPHAALNEGTRKIGHANPDFLFVHPLEQLGQPRRFLEPAARLGHSARGVHKLPKAHPSMLR